ncbi:alcohol dehydrogenase [Bradyrhizobium sp. SSBR45G]|uniref:pyrroloquinoline quinone-dependent dehydrogenase n=1 Tax=unclassified Bradyrhizobium TaxID=2631580 RepID=UPI0023429575|nr:MULTISPECIES: PQQ-binding-like beta-propeller repeat protein [unclassified Bradyrhizobium]GLH77677.1 alcohol dehydrogenase [Bradyrhizobium sp. SSBR45G]GLH84914.1 alcohol dehydrogenase [Bradyrhizobium sp. SSBR45R]
MMKQRKRLAAPVALAITTMLAASAASAQAVDTARIEAGGQNDWLTYHGSYKSYHYSPLAQINANNVANLGVAWMHIPGRSTRGLQSMPLAADGVLYYTGSYSRVFALNGATGEVIWSYFPELDEALVARQTHSPYNRGVAIGEGKVFVGTMDGRLIALDMKTGKLAWETKLIDSQKLTVGFTGAPLYANGNVVIGAQGGEWPGRGPIFGVNAATGAKKWEFLTVAGTEEAQKTWGNDSWRTGGGGGWMPGTYDSETSTIWWGTANPAPLYDWSGGDWKTQGARPGDNLYTSSVIGLDVDSGKLKFHHQELPHDAWDFDSAVGEFLMLDRDGKKLTVHPNKSGYIFVYDREAKVQNVWRITENSNFVKNIDPKTGELIGRRDFTAGKVSEPLCPHISGGVSWNAGSYNPKTGLYYKLGQEWCMTLDIVKTTPVVAPQAQLNIGANFAIAKPPSGEIYGHLDARDPVTGAKKWEVRFPEPPLASVLSTGGNLVFVPDSRGTVHAYDAENGTELWNHSDGTGHQGGIISYAVNGKQYIAITAGFGGMAADDYAPTFGGVYKSMPRDDGALIVYSLK